MLFGRKFVWVNNKILSEIFLGQQNFGRKFFWVTFFVVGFFCVCHPWWRTKRSWPLFSPTFSFFLFLRLLLFTHFGETPMAEINFPPIIWHNQKEYLKKYIVLKLSFILLRKKVDFHAAIVWSRSLDQPLYLVPGVFFSVTIFEFFI